MTKPKITELEGAEVSLELTKFLQTLNKYLEEGEAEEYFATRFTTNRWDDATHGWIEIPEGCFLTYVFCNDTFFWGGSDAEDLTMENLPLLWKTFQDLQPFFEKTKRQLKADRDEYSELNHAAYEEWRAKEPDLNVRYPGFHSEKFHGFPMDYQAKNLGTLCDLFSARSRGERPQGAAYKVRYPESTWPLFDAAGPEREVGLGNPRKPGE